MRTEPEAQVPGAWRFDLRATPARAEHYLVDSDALLASHAGADVLGAGGNAVDAAVTVAFVLAVVYPQAGNLGGGGFAVVRSAAGERAALDFRETAPAAASRDMFLDAAGAARRLPAAPGSAQQPGPAASTTGHLAAGVPGSVAGLWELHRRFGSRPWPSLLAPAVKLAEEGFTVDAELARSTAEALPRLSRFPASRALFAPDGTAPAAGDTFRNPDLARVLGRIAAEGRDGFYAGATARLLLREIQRGGGLIGQADLDRYQARWRQPIEFSYRGHTIISMPPPSSGGVALALIANTLAEYPLAQLGWHSPRHLHLLAEAMSRAFADRNSLLGDPDHVPVPLAQLLSPTYAQARRGEIGKRMLSSMAPTLVLDGHGDVRLVAGARGGPRIISSTWQVISNVLDFDMNVAQAVNAPRVHHQWQPEEIAVEQSGLLEGTSEELQRLGHRLRSVPDLGNAPAILRSPTGRGWTGIADPRKGGAAIGR